MRSEFWEPTLEETALGVAELEYLLRLGTEGAGRRGALALSREEMAQYRVLTEERDDVLGHVFTNEDIAQLMIATLPKEEVAGFIQTRDMSAEEAAASYRLAQAQEIIDVLDRHGVDLLLDENRLQCRLCGRVWGIAFTPLPGLTKEERCVRPGSGQLPFTGWRCPAGCSDRV